MRKVISSSIAVGLLVLGTLLAASIRADEWNKKTTVTFSEPVQIPGAVLPAGTYVFKLMDSPSDRNIVQIFNADETHLFATILTIPDYRPNPSDRTILSFDERPVGQPEALESWFYPGDDYGQEFVYPKQKATELAQVNKRPVPSIPDEVKEPAAMKTATVTRVVGNPPVANDAPTATATETTVTAVAIEKLPQTGSSLPLVAFVGMLCLVGALVLRRLSGLNS
jgi:LPXTG-motif cell wall-anchored protein